MLLLSEKPSSHQSFPAGSAGGLDGLRPQHLKDLVAMSVGEPGETVYAHCRLSATSATEVRFHHCFFCQWQKKIGRVKTFFLAFLPTGKTFFWLELQANLLVDFF